MKEFRALSASLILHAIVAWILAQWETLPTQRPVAFTPVEVDYQILDKQVNLDDLLPEDNKTESDEKAKILHKKKLRVLKETKAPAIGPTKNRVAAQNQSKKLIPPLPSLQRLSGTGVTLPPLKKPAESSGSVTTENSTQSFDLENVDVGDMTFLNTDFNLFYFFFERVAAFTGHLWNQNVVELMHHYNQIGFAQNPRGRFTTGLLVKLNLKGELQSVDITQSSGLPGLDNAAVDAFKAGTPIPNPPAAMKGDDGLIHIHVRFVVIGWNPSI